MESKVSVFPAAASLQTGSSTDFSTDGGFSVQVSVCIFSLSWHLTPITLRFGAWDLGF